MDDAYNNIDDYDPKKKQKSLMTWFKSYLLDTET